MMELPLTIQMTPQPHRHSPSDSSRKSGRSLHSASGFGKPSRSPFPEPGKEQRDDAMDALRKSLDDLNQATSGR